MIGGYYIKYDENPQPFLDSPITDWQFGEMNTTELCVIGEPTIAIERSLYQYRKFD